MQIDYAYENRTVLRELLQHDCNEDYIVTRDYHRVIDSLRAAQLIFFMQPGTFLDQLPYNV